MKKIILKITIKAFVYFLIISSIISILLFYLYTNPKKFKGEITPQEFNLSWQNVNIESQNKNLKGWLIENKKTKLAIILMHGWPADKSDILPFTYFLYDFATLLYIDIRGLGESEGYICGSKYEIEDIQKWIKFLKERGFSDIAIFGYSYGGFLALRAAYEIKSLKFVISDSPFTSIYNIMIDIIKNYSILKYPIIFLMNIEYRIICGEKMDKFNINTYIKDFKTPILIICGNKDNLCYHQNLINYNKINPVIKVELMEGLTHGETLINKKYKKIIKDFIRSLK
ncbi:MAG: alpha/beta hydrolase [Elusimicrobiales bacterium]|nr:alpha/beta hydrolase [Elusimicrobiales bacterium]